jgi:hypothetical protein
MDNFSAIYQEWIKRNTPGGLLDIMRYRSFFYCLQGYD